MTVYPAVLMEKKRFGLTMKFLRHLLAEYVVLHAYAD